MSIDISKHGSHVEAGFCLLTIHFPRKMTRTTQHVAQKTPEVPFFVLYNEAPRLLGNGTPSNSTCLIRACCRFASKIKTTTTARTFGMMRVVPPKKETHLNQPTRFLFRCYMDVSENNGTPKSSILIGVFHYKPSILGHPYFGKHPYSFELFVF